MKVKIRIFTTLFLFLSCSSRPPVGIKPIPLLDLIYLVSTQTVDLKGKREELQEYMDKMRDDPLYVTFFKGENLLIRDSRREVSPQSFIHSDGSGNLLVTRPVHITMKGSKYIFSLDGKTWYIQDNDRKKGRENVLYDYTITPLLSTDHKTLTVDYSWEARLNPEAQEVKVGVKKIINLAEGQVFEHSDQKRVNRNFKKEILLIPAGTLISMNMNVAGNLFLIETLGEGVTVEAARDLYLYSEGKKIGLSFDGEHWGISLLAFRFKRNNYWIATSDNSLFMDNSVQLGYGN